jgi:hypothetical protein
MLQFVDYSSLIHLRNSGCGHKMAVQAIFFSPPSPSLSLSVLLLWFGILNEMLA